MITALFVMTAVFSLPPLMDVARPASPVTARLRTSVGYDLIAPLSNVLDALTLLSPALYWATFALCTVTVVGFWIFRRVSSRAAFTRRSSVRAALRFAGGTIAVAGMMLVAKRPMASLVLGDPDLLAIDFHSHTSASHDGRPGFDAEKNREWHSSSGFDVAYVTDHRTFDGALSGRERNPATAGGGTVLLPGVELRDGDEHPILIGVDPKRMRIASADWKGAAGEADDGAAPPMLFVSLPGDVLRIPLSLTSGVVRVAGIEVSDGSPRGIAQSTRDREAILALADKLGVAIVSASDNHGWGRAAPAWSVMRVPGWREMTPSNLDLAIRRTIAIEGPRAVQVIARRIAPLPTNSVDVALGGVAVGLVMLRTMSLPDRLSWLGWSWGLCLVSLHAARGNREKLRVRARKRTMTKARPPNEAAA